MSTDWRDITGCATPWCRRSTRRCSSRATFRVRGWPALARAAAARPGTVAELVVEVQGISCAGCVWLIEKLFHEQPGALAIETDATIRPARACAGRAGRFDAAGVRADAARLRLPGRPRRGPRIAGEEAGESRRLLRRAGFTCAAFAMNLMLFALPRYFGMEASFPYARLFDTLALALATLAVLVGGTYFLGRAVRALRHGALHIDLPIALGITGAYAGSVAGWALGRESFMYFDFVGAFITLMLLGRWAQVAAVERNRRRLLSGQAGPSPVTVVAAAGESALRPAEAVRTGDVFEVRAGQVVPVEARLETPAASFGTAWITGEAEPRDYRAGGRVPAGAVVAGARRRCACARPQDWAESLLAQLLQPGGARDAFQHPRARTHRGRLPGGDPRRMAALAAAGWAGGC